MDNSPQAGVIAPGGLSGAELFDTPGVVALKYNGALHDLFLPVPKGLEVKPVMITSEAVSYTHLTLPTTPYV